MSNEALIERAARVVGNQAALAKALGLSYQAISKWKYAKRIPAERVLDLERVSGIPRYELRPDLYPVAAPRR